MMIEVNQAEDENTWEETQNDIQVNIDSCIDNFKVIQAKIFDIKSSIRHIIDIQPPKLSAKRELRVESSFIKLTR